MKLTLNKETLRTLSVKSAVKAGLAVHSGFECVPAPPPDVVPTVGTFSIPGKCTPLFDPNKFGNPADAGQQVGQQLGAGLNP